MNLVPSNPLLHQVHPKEKHHKIKDNIMYTNTKAIKLFTVTILLQKSTKKRPWIQMKEKKRKKRETAPTFKSTQARHDVEPKGVQTNMTSACGAPRGPVGALNRCPSSPGVVGLVLRRLHKGEWVMERERHASACLCLAKPSTGRANLDRDARRL
jgi:hypothetical protein